MRSFILAILLFSFSANGQQRPFSYDLWLNEANTPVKINDIIQGNSGYLWLATDIGLYNFNGRDFSFFPDSIHKPITALTYFMGRLYLGYANGQIAFLGDNNKVQLINVRGEIPTSAIRFMYWDASRVLWLCTETQGIIALINNTGVAINRRNGLSDNFVYTLSLKKMVHILVASDAGINEITMKKGKIKINAFNTSNGLPDNIVTVLKPLPDRINYIVGTQSGGLAIYNSEMKKISALKTDSAWAWGQINDILPIDNNKSWIATEDGYLLEATIKDTTRLTIRPFLFNGKRMRKLLLGRSGIIWCATNQGLTMLTAEYMEYIPLSNPYKLTDIKAICCDKNDVIWFSQGNTLFRLYQGRKEITPKAVYQAPATIISIYCDMENRLWMGTLGKGVLYRDTTGLVTPIKDIPQLDNENVINITGTDDRLWISGSLNGVAEVTYPGPFTKKMSLIRQHNKRSGVGSNYVYNLFPDRRGRIWMATDGGGICMYSQGVYSHWDSSSGFTSSVVYSTTQDGMGNIWVSTLSKGLFQFDGNRWTQLSREQGLQDVNVATLASNATGQIVAVQSKGIDVWYPFSRQFRNYNRRPGINIDSTSSTLNLYAKDNAGNVYIPFERGLAIFKNIVTTYDIRPMVHILSVSVFFKNVENNTTFFSYDQNHISFHFDGVNFANPERLHYRYKLEGYNDGWIVTNDESVTFPQLPPGTYTFNVQASLNNTFSRLGEATYTFTVDKPFWWRPWFIFLIALLLIGISYGYVRFREENLRKVSSLERERMMFEYEHLKSQVNPHFLFNSLNTLASLIEEDGDIAVKYTVHLSDLYRNMLSYRDKDLILLSEEWEILQNYLYIQQSRFGNALRLNAYVPKYLMETKKVVPLALQLLVENAIKHNVVSKAAPLTITIEADEETITIRNPLQLKMSKEKGAGLGLVNIRKRYSLLTKRQIIYGEKNNEYIVILPLI